MQQLICSWNSTTLLETVTFTFTWMHRFSFGFLYDMIEVVQMDIAILFCVVKIHLICCSCAGCNNAIIRHDCQSMHHVRSYLFNEIGQSQSLLGNFSKYSIPYTLYIFCRIFPSTYLSIQKNMNFVSQALMVCSWRN